MESSSLQNNVQPCQICGSAERAWFIVTCSKCNRSREHIYCMKQDLQYVPESWHCEACRCLKRDHRETRYADGPRDPEQKVGNSSKRPKARATWNAACKKPDLRKVTEASSFRSTTRCLSRNFVPKMEKTGKVQCLSFEEVAGSSRAKPKLSALQGGLTSQMPSPGINQHSNTKRTPLAVVASPRSSIVKDHLYTARSPKPTTLGKVGTSVLQKKAIESSQSLHDLASPSHFTCKSSSSENLRNVAIPSTREKKPVSEALGSPLSHMMPVVSGVPDTFECDNPSSRLDKHAGKKESLLPKDYVCKEGHIKTVIHCAEVGISKSKVPFKFGEEYLPNPPAVHALWKGCFEFSDFSNEVFDGFQAYPPGKVSRKAYLASKQMPQLLKFTLQPRHDVWPKTFHTESPSGYSIALYFWAEDFCRVTYNSLVELMDKKDLCMASHLDGVDLLIFTSRQLPCESQRMNTQFYLWGVFLPLKQKLSPVNVEGRQNAINISLHNFKVGEASSSVPLEVDGRSQQPIEKNTVPRHLEQMGTQQADDFDVPPGFSDSDVGPGFSRLTTSNAAGVGPLIMSLGKMSPAAHEMDSSPGFSKLTKLRARDSSSKEIAYGLRRDSITASSTGKNRFHRPWGSFHASDRSRDGTVNNFRAKYHVWDRSRQEKERW